MSPQEHAFVVEYLRHFNASRAARDAGYSPRSSARQGFELLRRPEVQQAIAAATAERLARANIDADFVLREWAAIATADVNEIMQHRRVCCRYCHGIDGKYQRTQSEYDRDLRAHEADPARSLVAEFDPLGGIGYNATLEPNPQCVECFGEGEARLHIVDTRDLSPGARALFAGIKQTKDGVEVKFHSKDKALELIARHLGMLKDKLEVEGTIGLVERLAAGRQRVKSGSDLAG